MSFLINPLVTNGLSNPYHLNESSFISRDIMSNFSLPAPWCRHIKELCYVNINFKVRPNPSQLTKNVSGTFGFGCMKVCLNLTLLERNAYVRRFSYKCLVEPNVLKTLFKYSDSV